MKAYVYCIKSGPYVKIGISRRPYARMRQLQMATPYELEMKYLFYCEYARDFEYDMHNELDHLRFRNEWFYYDRQAVRELFELFAEGKDMLPEKYTGDDRYFYSSKSKLPL